MQVTFKTFISESKREKLGSRANIQTFDDLFAYLDQDCKQYLKACSDKGQFILFRGEALLDHTFSLADSTQFVRRSSNTENWYNLWIDNSSQWKNYPKRLSSFICTTSPSVATDYGYFKVVIPLDGAKMAIAPSGDIWNSFEMTLDKFYGSYSPETLYAFQQEIKNLWSMLYPDEPLEQTNFLRLKSQLSRATYDEMAKLAQTNLVKVTLSSMKKNNCDSLADVFDFVLDPSLNEFKMLPLFQAASIPRNSEVWIQGECIFITANNLSDKYMEELEDYFSRKNIDVSLLNKHR